MHLPICNKFISNQKETRVTDEEYARRQCHGTASGASFSLPTTPWQTGRPRRLRSESSITVTVELLFGLFWFRLLSMRTFQCQNTDRRRIVYVTGEYLAQLFVIKASCVCRKTV
ncbi:hypothetical protein GWI33_004953 [Rhynchophorus ferrugineus]|uniref:Uncharacterized protein n=1 Tax=Rhynchophorus ferrugineus TaxID=354439 RepID=A0A834ISM6_RHYFE|nr:hypothetical protein GWI33_004953 [Rhynchophorus ferrugineus]